MVVNRHSRYREQIISEKQYDEYSFRLFCKNNRSQGSHKLILVLAGMEIYRLLQIFFQQLRIHRHYDGAQTHQHRAKRRAKHKLGVYTPAANGIATTL